MFNLTQTQLIALINNAVPKYIINGEINIKEETDLYINNKGGHKGYTLSDSQMEFTFINLNNNWELIEIQFI